MTTHSSHPAAVCWSGWRWRGRCSIATRTSFGWTQSPGCLPYHTRRLRTATPISVPSIIPVLGRRSWSCCMQMVGSGLTSADKRDPNLIRQMLRVNLISSQIGPGNVFTCWVRTVHSPDICCLTCLIIQLQWPHIRINCGFDFIKGRWKRTYIQNKCIQVLSSLSV